MNDLQQKRRKPHYRKPESVKDLEQLYFEYESRKRPNIPNYARYKTPFRDDTANGLTKCIVKWLEAHGYFSARINTQGNYSTKLKRFIHSGSKRGMADITSIINGRHVSIEVKAGRDQLRPEQLKVKDEVENAGGIYFVARTFDNFLEQINSIILT